MFTDEGLIYMVQEYGEIDLARLLAKHDAARREAAGPDRAHRDRIERIDENFIRLYWQQMLQVGQGVTMSAPVDANAAIMPASAGTVGEGLKGMIRCICCVSLAAGTYPHCQEHSHTHACTHTHSAYNLAT